MYDVDQLKSQEQTDLGIKHHFSDGIYAKQMYLPKGHIAISHKHAYSHLSVLSGGKCTVETDEGIDEYSAPACIEIKAGVEHQIYAVEDVTWFCIHATDEKDVEKIDKVAIENASL